MDIFGFASALNLNLEKVTFTKFKYYYDSTIEPMLLSINEKVDLVVHLLDELHRNYKIEYEIYDTKNMSHNERKYIYRQVSKWVSLYAMQNWANIRVNKIFKSYRAGDLFGVQIPALLVNSLTRLHHVFPIYYNIGHGKEVGIYYYLCALLDSLKKDVNKKNIWKTQDLWKYIILHKDPIIKILENNGVIGFSPQLLVTGEEVTMKFYVKQTNLISHLPKKINEIKVKYIEF